MDPALIPLLRCPRSHTPLTLEGASYRDGRIWAGTLRSQSGHAWPIRAGIAHLIDRPAAWNGAQLVNRLPWAAWGYERLWRWRALSWLSGRRFGLAEELALVVEHIQPRPGGAYLDLACSTGLYGRALAGELPDGGPVVAFDHSAAMLREADRYARAEGLRLSLVRGLAENLPFADGAFAGLACGGSFSEFRDRDRVLSEARRTLRRDGRSVWMQAQRAPSLAGRALQAALAPGGVRFPPGQELARGLQSAGLRVTIDQREGAVQIIASHGRILPSPMP
ncbi:MAG TPA: class I SAM-dependent methyltransferase [Herpetosiphonaceae bacterium]|nr:class I SAM-dependent methyltransferase [Herpetosiphonaceae bacterium]